MDATIKSSFWSDTRIEDLPAEQKLALLWLLTNPSRDLCGFTRVSPRRFQFETGISAEVLDSACEGVRSSFYPPSEGVYFAVHFIRHQFGKGGALNLKNKVIVAAARHAHALPLPLRSAFFSAYPELLSLVENSSPIDPPSENPEGVRVRERAEQSIGSNLSKEREDQIGRQATQIVEAYPRKEKLASALQTVTAHLKAGDSFETMLSGTRACAAVIRTLPSGSMNRYVPGAEAFFREKRWQDDPESLRRQGNSNNGSAPMAEDDALAALGGRGAYLDQ